MLLNINFSGKARIVWSFLLAMILSGAAVAEACALNAEKAKEELSWTDDENRQEGERAEDNENRGEKSAESLFEGGDGDGNNGFAGKKLQGILSVSGQHKLLPFQCCYAYYPHINNTSSPNEHLFVLPPLPLSLLYHSLIFYDRNS